MDADLKAALDAAADDAAKEYQTSRASAVELKRVLTDGVCRIVDVTDNLHPPCVGEIHTDLGETFPIFALFTREQAKSLKGKRVKLAIEMSARGTRYVVGMHALPQDTSTEVWPCPRCGGIAMLRRPLRVSTVAIYSCVACAYQMEVEP